MPIVPHLLRILPAIAASALLAAPTARADVIRGKLQVSAEVTVTCRLEASVPRMGTPNRNAGTASFSVTCTRGASAIAASCAAECPPAASADKRRMEYRIGERRDDGATVATVLF